MTTVQWPGVQYHQGMSPEEFRTKLELFGMNRVNFTSEAAKYSRVRVKEDKAAAWNWCQKKLGNNWIWSSPFQSDYCDIYFLYHEDALVFKLAFNTI